MNTSSLNLTNSIDLIANSIKLKEPDGTIVDITDLFATQDQLSGNGSNNGGFVTLFNLNNFILPAYTTQTDVSNSLLNYTPLGLGNANYYAIGNLTLSLALTAPIDNPVFTGSISTPAITLNGTSIATTLAGKPHEGSEYNKE